MESVSEAPQPEFAELDLLAQLDRLEDLVDAITSSEPRTAHGELAAEASRRVHAATDRLAAQRFGWLGQVDSDGMWALETMRTLPHWLAWKENLSLPAARRAVKTARALRDDLPETARQARSGQVTSEHVGVLTGVAATSDARRDALQAHYEADAEQDQDNKSPTLTGEQVLLNLASKHSLRDFAQIARRFAHVSDPEADERGYRLAHEREHLEISRTLGGFHLAGFLTEEHGQTLKTALAAVIGTPSADDKLTATQRRATALAGLAGLVLDNGLAGTGSAVRPHLSIHVPWNDFQALAQDPLDVKPDGSARSSESCGPDNTATRIKDLDAILSSPGPTWEDGTGPVPQRLLERIASDCHMTRIVFGPDSEILNVGRTQRTLSGTKRRAVIARDKHCVWPNCDAPPQLGQIHHAKRHWADGGETSTDNAALLCWFHHQHVDTRNIAMHWNDGWQFSEPGSYRAA